MNCSSIEYNIADVEAKSQKTKMDLCCVCRLLPPVPQMYICCMSEVPLVYIFEAHRRFSSQKNYRNLAHQSGITHYHTESIPIFLPYQKEHSYSTYTNSKLVNSTMLEVAMTLPLLFVSSVFLLHRLLIIVFVIVHSTTFIVSSEWSSRVSAKSCISEY